MKKTILLLAVTLTSISAFAQSLSIKGMVVSEDSIPVVSANIVLQNANNELIAGTETNKKGEFVLQSVAAGSDYKLSISYVGYETTEFEFEKPTKDIDLQIIILFSATTELEGAVVKSAKSKITDDRRIIYPTQKQLQITADGVSLLNAMNLPRLSIVPGTAEVIYWGRSGSLKFYINDNEATTKQIRNLSPKDIVCIEYIDRPNIEYGAGVELVIKYITKKIERGVTNSISIGKPLNRNSGGIDVESRINYKNSEFAVNYDIGYDKSKHFNVTETDETFYLNSGTLHRNEITTGQTGSGVNNDIALAYIYSRPKKERFYIKTQYTSRNVPESNTTSVLYHSGIRNDTTNKYNLSARKNKTFTSDIYFRKYFNDKQFITLRSTYYSTQLDNPNNYKEIDNNNIIINDIINNVNANSQGLYAQALYNISFSDKIKLTTALLNQYTNAKNTYTGTNASFSNVRRNLTTSHNQLSGSFGKFYIDLYLLLRRDYADISNQYEYVRISFDPSISGRYVFTDRNYIGFDMYFGFSRPNIADLSEATQIIDDIQVRRGNPNLKSGYYWGSSLNGNVGIGKFDIDWYANYEYTHNDAEEKTFLENNIVIRSADNLKQHYNFHCGLTASAELFEWFNFSAFVGNAYFANNDYGNYNKTYNNLRFRLNATAIWNRWSLTTTMWTFYKGFYGETMWTGGQGLFFTLLRTWFDSRLSTSLTISNPFFKKYNKSGAINYSQIAPYENWMYYTGQFRRLSLNISYKFNFGRKSSDTGVKTGVQSETGTVSRDKSAEQK